MTMTVLMERSPRLAGFLGQPNIFSVSGRGASLLQPLVLPVSPTCRPTAPPRQDPGQEAGKDGIPARKAAAAWASLL